MPDLAKRPVRQIYPLLAAIRGFACWSLDNHSRVQYV